jgi:glycine/D-amino acid oxidase-like deaminating enzyme
VETVDFLIVGGGIAGLATAAALAAPDRRVLLLDREVHPGFHASGHNAAIARQLTGRAEHTTLTLAGRQALGEAGLVDDSGGLLLAAEPGALDGLAAEAEAFGVAVQRGAGAVLPGLSAAEHLRTPTDGIIDIHGELGLCARRAREGGAVIRYGCGVTAIAADAEGFTVTTEAGPVRTPVLVNAAGAWAGSLGRQAGGLDIPFRPLRRHLAFAEGDHPRGPYAWWVDRPLYVRPEQGGLLLCPCDEVEVRPPDVGRQPDTDPGVLAGLAQSLTELAPHLLDAPIVRAWSGLRTFAPDRRFVIGWDPVNPRLFWVAGLGGHGMTSGLGVGRLAAELLLGGGRHELDPGRLA